MGRRHSNKPPDRLEELEAIVEAGLDSFVKAGEALTEIRENKLYKPQYATFAVYAEARFSIGRARAYQLITAAATIANLKAAPDRTSLPASERQARALAKIEPERQAEVWQAAQEQNTTDQPTASQIDVAAETTLPERVRTKPEPPAEPEANDTLEWIEGERIITWRTSQMPMSQEELAEKLRVPVATLQRWESTRAPKYLGFALNWIHYEHLHRSKQRANGATVAAA